MVMSFACLMEKRLEEADADDYSRIAWLCLHLSDDTKARVYTKAGLERDPYNDHCQKLARKLSIPISEPGKNIAP